MGFATRGWYPLAVLTWRCDPEPCVRGLAERGAGWRAPDGQPAVRWSTSELSSRCEPRTVQLILAANRGFPIAPDCLPAVRVVGLLNNAPNWN